MKRLLREPLLHVLLGGAALFLLHGAVSSGGPPARDRIVVGEARVQSLASSFERTWMRPPTREELQGLVDDYVTEEVLYREALALGLDRDDLVVRRRMRQKMEFLHQDLVEMAEPDDATLRAFLEEEPERFRIPERVSLQQVFVSSAGAAAEERARALRERLREEPGLDAETLGDPTLLPARLTSVTREQVADTYGRRFAEAVAGMPEGTWTGPVASDFGLHLVRIRAREPGRLPSLAEARPRVVREWEAERRQRAREQLYREMRARYEVEIQMPGAADDEALASRER